MIARISDASGVSGFEDEAVDAILPYAKSLGVTQRGFHAQSLSPQSKKTTGTVLWYSWMRTPTRWALWCSVSIPTARWAFCRWAAGSVPTFPRTVFRVRTRSGVYIPGLTASKPPHFMTEQERRAPLEMDSITVDVGAVSSGGGHSGLRDSHRRAGGAGGNFLLSGRSRSDDRQSL
jgi:hypothetical protein